MEFNENDVRYRKSIGGIPPFLPSNYCLEVPTRIFNEGMSLENVCKPSNIFYMLLFAND